MVWLTLISTYVRCTATKIFNLYFNTTNKRKHYSMDLINIRLWLIIWTWIRLAYVRFPLTLNFVPLIFDWIRFDRVWIQSTRCSHSINLRLSKIIQNQPNEYYSIVTTIRFLQNTEFWKMYPNGHLISHKEIPNVTIYRELSFVS